MSRVSRLGAGRSMRPSGSRSAGLRGEDARIVVEALRDDLAVANLVDRDLGERDDPAVAGPHRRVPLDADRIALGEDLARVPLGALLHRVPARELRLELSEAGRDIARGLPRHRAF